MNKGAKGSLTGNKGRHSLDGIDGFTTGIDRGSIFASTLVSCGYTMAPGNAESNSEPDHFIRRQ